MSRRLKTVKISDPFHIGDHQADLKARQISASLCFSSLYERFY